MFGDDIFGQIGNAIAAKNSVLQGRRPAEGQLPIDADAQVLAVLRKLPDVDIALGRMSNVDAKVLSQIGRVNEAACAAKYPDAATALRPVGSFDICNLVLQMGRTGLFD